MEQTSLRDGLGEGGDRLQDAVEELGVGVLVLARGVRQDADDEPAVVLDLEVRVDLHTRISLQLKLQVKIWVPV
jgi:hypothetical protein